MGATRGTIEERFWRFVSPEPTSGCWLWTGALTNRYGALKVPKTVARAHVLSWEFRNGPLPPKKWVLHKCDVPVCVNPDHLFLGTAMDNTRDMMQKGRGSSPPRNAKLTKEKADRIRAMRATGMIARRISGIVGTSISNVYSVVRGVTWRGAE